MGCQRVKYSEGETLAFNCQNKLKGNLNKACNYIAKINNLSHLQYRWLEYYIKTSESFGGKKLICLGQELFTQGLILLRHLCT